MLAALVGAASARKFSTSSQAVRATFRRLDYSGGFGTAECEVVIEGTFHRRRAAKLAGMLMGYLTAGNVTRCARGGATIDREMLPWHLRYTGFTGTLPNITSIAATASGLAFRMREPIFGVTCRVTGASTSVTLRLGAGRAATEASVSGTTSCSGITGTLSGSTTSVDNRAGARITVTLI